MSSYTKRKKAVEYYLDGRNAWKRGFTGQLLRIRGVLISVFISIAFLTGPPWWFKYLPSFFPDYLVIRSSIYFSGVLLYFFSLLVLILVYLRKRTLRSLHIKFFLHQLAHQSRNKEAEIYRKIITDKTYSSQKIENQLKVYLTKITELIKKYFQLLLNTNEIDIAIRIATIEKKKSDGKSTKIVYKTYIRSNGLNPRRDEHSENIPLDEGIPLYLRKEKQCLGVLIYNDLYQAENEKKYKFTKNDTEFPNEIKTMMVAPVNGYVKDSIDMVGILYVTSSKENVFSEKDIDSISFVADMLGMSISNIIHTINLKSANQ